MHEISNLKRGMIYISLLFQGICPQPFGSMFLVLWQSRRSWWWEYSEEDAVHFMSDRKWREEEYRRDCQDTTPKTPLVTYFPNYTILSNNFLVATILWTKQGIHPLIKSELISLTVFGNTLTDTGRGMLYKFPRVSQFCYACKQDYLLLTQL